MKSLISKIGLVGFLLLFANSKFIQAATWTDHGNYSLDWYDKDESVYNISTAEELAGIAYLVNNNFTDFAGKTFIITNDISLLGNYWMPIGLGNKYFQGNIDGGNHTVSNIDIRTATSGSPFSSGFFIQLKNSNIKNINFLGEISVGTNYVGFLCAVAYNCNFENIKINCGLDYYRTDISVSTSYSYNSIMAGMVGSSDSCSYKDIYVNNSLNYVFGASGGSSCYGDVQLYCGGIVGAGSYDKFFKCHAVNYYSIELNGYVTTSTYTNYSPSYVTFGGIVGSLKGNTSEVIACLAENKYFYGYHPVGTFDTKSFRYGGLVGYMSNYDNASLKNSVAINDKYTIKGHAYSWQAAWYHTNSNFGGVAYSVPKNFVGCYSNNDVTKTISQVRDDYTMENGSISFSKSQMNSQSFVDELNLYSQMEFGQDYWTLESEKLALKKLIQPEEIVLSEEMLEMTVGEKHKVGVTILPEGSETKISWTTSDEEIATVDNGEITALGVGSVTIKATTDNGLSAELNVTVNPIVAETVQLNVEETEMTIEETLQLEAKVLPENATDNSVTWVSSNEEVATVSETGLVKAISVGEAVITAACGEVSASCRIIVLEDAGVESILGNPETKISIYTPQGLLIKKDCKVEDLKTLKKGIYIVVSGKERYKISI